MLKKLGHLIIWILLPVTLLAQPEVFIKNYPPVIYKASPTVFNLTLDSTGVLYFGTNKGVVTFDGARWDIIPISNFSGVKTLETGPDGKIYVGANDNFGYLAHEVLKGLHYVSLSDSLPRGTGNFNDVWQIVFLGDTVYFQTYSKIFKWDYNNNIVVDALKDTYLYNIHGKLFASSYNTYDFGPYQNGTIKSIRRSSEILKDFVFQVFEYDHDNDLIITSETGLFLLSHNQREFKPLECEVKKFINKYSFYDGIRINSDLYALGSWEGGIIFMNKAGAILDTLDNQSGLFANHIYDMRMDKSNNLWLATSYGISKIPLDSLGFPARQKSNNSAMPIITKVNFTISNESFEIFLPGNIDQESFRLKKDILNILQPPSALSFYFAIPAYAGDDVTWSVFLDGYDSKWSDWKNEGDKEYTHLKEGKYTFYVQAKCRSKNESSEIKAIPLIVSAPWFHSVWLKVVIAILIVFGVFFVVRLMITRLKTQNLRLEKIVNERTEDLLAQQKELRKLNNELLTTNRELDSFVYHTSHDLKAPLKSVLGLLHLAKKEDKSHKLRPYHDRIEGSISKLEEFISSIIQYSSSANSDMSIKKIDFQKIIHESLEELDHHEAFEKIDIRKSIDDNSVFHSDEKRIKIIINNLLSNAVKYYDREKENPFVKIKVTVQNGKATIVVEDNGTGIPSHLQPKVFSMFFRASESSYGSGLGLYIIRETVKKLHGTIHLESEFGKYCRFIIHLPDLKAKSTTIIDFASREREKS